MAAGAGMFVVAIVSTGIVLFSLWPLNRILGRLQSEADDTVRIRLRLADLRSLGPVTREISALNAEVAEVRSERSNGGHYDVDLDVRPPPDASADLLRRHLHAIVGVEATERL
jgi:uncharacterized membrane protein YhiD involved in acid resistance